MQGTSVVPTNFESRNKKLWFKFPLVVILSFLLLVIGAYSFGLDQTQFNNLYRLRTPKTTGTKLILFWTSFFSRNDFYFGLGTKPFEDNCNMSNCETTADRNQLRDADAVIFHLRDLNFNNMPPYRDVQRQKWVFYLLESPQYTNLDLTLLNYIFNWTMTYRRDSDIPKLYGAFTNGSASIRIDPKRKPVAWLVSNCRTASRREIFVKQLAEHIPLDVYGRCGKRCKETEDETCDRMIGRSYKFYLAFENSICKDYVTEKFFKSLLYGSVPVVYGGADYAAISPPHSYIDALNFSTPRDLAEYLKLLDRDESLYAEYHRWRSSYRVTFESRAFCDLCAKLHGDNRTKVYGDVNGWWTSMGNCRVL